MSSSPTTAANNRNELPFAGAGIDQLVSIWLAELDAFTAFAMTLTATDWSSESPCPGWTAGDVVAHVLSLESELHGVPLPDHEPDWGALPHVVNPIGKSTEIGVDWYRNKSRDVVLAELREIVEWRRQDLAALSRDPDEVMTGPFGWQASPSKIIRTRILDTWMHEQDLRTTAHQPGGLASDAALVTAAQFVGGLPYVWSRGVGAPVGASLQTSITGPGVEISRTVVVNESGRGEFVDGLADQPTLRFETGWPMFAGLCGGRLGAIAEAQNGRVEFHGDFDLSQRLLPALAMTP